MKGILPMRLVQFHSKNKITDCYVAIVSDDECSLHVMDDFTSTYQLAQKAIATGQSLIELISSQKMAETIDYSQVITEGRLLAPVTHPDPAHMLVTGTGLTHLGSASTRSAMHEKADTELTDSMKMFKWGIEAGKPAEGELGSEPEWFFKGDGSWVVAPGQALEIPDFSLDGGEEPEIAGIYCIGNDHLPYRIGYVIANEFSDHVLERQNYLLLAHSKLRTSSIGPELLIGDLPPSVEGKSRILRNNEVIWEKDFVSGEENMSHSIANLENHHFKYSRFRTPGDLHVHFFGTSTLSFADQIKAQPGDIFEISANGFGKPLQNTLVGTKKLQVGVKSL
jgi:hypothetical protein